MHCLMCHLSCHLVCHLSCYLMCHLICHFVCHLTCHHMHHLMHHLACHCMCCLVCHPTCHCVCCQLAHPWMHPLAHLHPMTCYLWDCARAEAGWIQIAWRKMVALTWNEKRKTWMSLLMQVKLSQMQWRMFRGERNCKSKSSQICWKDTNYTTQSATQTNWWCSETSPCFILKASDVLMQARQLPSSGMMMKMSILHARYNILPTTINCLNNFHPVNKVKIRADPC